MGFWARWTLCWTTPVGARVRTSALPVPASSITVRGWGIAARGQAHQGLPVPMPRADAPAHASGDHRRVAGPSPCMRPPPPPVVPTVRQAQPQSLLIPPQRSDGPIDLVVKF